MHAAVLEFPSRAYADERLPPKAERTLDKELAKKVLVAITVASKLCAIARKNVLEKRKGGEEGRFLRGWGIWYTRGLGAPVWQSAIIWDLDRKQIGQEEAAFIDMLSRNEELADEAETLQRVCDEAIRFNPKTFIREGLSERLADAAAKKAVKVVREAVDKVLANAPKPVTRIPPSKQVSADIERLQAEANARHKADALEAAVRRARAVIEKAKGEKSTKEQRKDAERAEKELDALLRELEGKKRRKAT